jgi:hypothetical protein
LSASGLRNTVRYDLGMHTSIIALVASLTLSPETNSPNGYVDVDDEPTILEVDAEEATQPDGRRARWTSVTYQLSSGQIAEAFVEVDEQGHGEAMIHVDGEPLLHATTGGSTWVAPEIDLPPEVIVQLVSVDIANQVFAGVVHEPLKGPCSKWVRAAKYAWLAAIGVAEVICCSGAPIAGCVVCTGLAVVAAAAGDDIEEDYCG